MAKRSSTFAVYLSFGTLRTGVDALKTSGFRNGDISVLFPEEAVSKTMPSDGDSSPETSQTAQPLQPLIGGTLGWLTYINPSGTGVISGALISLGVPSYEAERYEGRLQNGGLLLCVRSGSVEQAERAYEALSHSGAEDVIFAEEGRSCVGGRTARSTLFGPVVQETVAASAHN